MLRADLSSIRMSSESGLILLRKNASQIWKDNPYQHHCALWSYTTALLSGLLCPCHWCFQCLRPHLPMLTQRAERGVFYRAGNSLQLIFPLLRLSLAFSILFYFWALIQLKCKLFCAFFSKRDLIQADLSILYMPKTFALREWSKFAVPSFK